MAQDELRRAIQLMQDGGVDEAVALLQRLLNGPTLDAKGRAAAYVWLAEARDDREYKRRCLELALECEPDNRQIRQGLSDLLAMPAQPGDLPRMGAAPGNAAERDRAPLVEISGSRNGLASGIPVSRDGLLATTSYAVGSAEELRARLPDEGELAARVVRRYPQYDLALIWTGVELGRLPTVAPRSMIAPNMAIVALGCGGRQLRGHTLAAERGAPRSLAGHNDRASSAA